MEDTTVLDDNEKAILFSMLPENSVTISGAFMWAFKGDMLKAAMFSRYIYCYLKNEEQPIIYKDKTIAEQYFCPEISVKRKKSELKNEGLISVVQKGIPAIGYISANIEKALEILVNFKKYQIDTSGDINLIPHTKDNNNNNNNHLLKSMSYRYMIYNLNLFGTRFNTKLKKAKHTHNGRKQQIMEKARQQ